MCPTIKERDKREVIIEGRAQTQNLQGKPQAFSGSCEIIKIITDVQDCLGVL